MNQIVETVHAVQLYLASVPASSWYVLAVFLGASGLTASTIQVVKKRYNLKHEEELAKHWILLLLGLIPLCITFLQGLIMYGTTNPKFLGERTLDIIGMSTTLFLLLSSISKSAFVAKIQAWANNGRTALNTLEAPAVPTPAAAVPDSTDNPLF